MITIITSKKRFWSAIEYFKFDWIPSYQPWRSYSRTSRASRRRRSPPSRRPARPSTGESGALLNFFWSRKGGRGISKRENCFFYGSFQVEQTNYLLCSYTFVISSFSYTYTVTSSRRLLFFWWPCVQKHAERSILTLRVCGSTLFPWSLDINVHIY